MNNIYHGDLTDIIRAGGGDPPPETSADTPSWQFHSNSSNYATCPADDFGDPFAYLRDPLLHRAPPEFFHSSGMIKAATNGGGFFGNINLGHRILDDGMERPPNILSRMPQISPAIKISISPAAVGVSPTGLVLSEDLTSISPSSMQISSPQNAGIRRRKSQTKKVLCIPAPIPAGSSRPTAGEVVPSDLWAWRKYGQKPIKGSPYPRGYYRCSSSKGCLARKQVERSRTDPNMLVITYTSDHNHPWPTKRNALAGSTRTHPSKTSSKSKNQKEEHTEINTEHVAPSLPNSAAVKAEAEMHDGGEFDDSFFANLGEIEGDSLDFLFAKGFDGHDGKDLDSFTFCDWDDDLRITKSSRATLSDKNL